MKKIFYFKENESLDLLVNYLVLFKNNEAILLDGELGAGKTTLTAQIAKKLGETKQVISPTFNTLIIYDNIVHIDAYKLKGDLFAYEEYFENKLAIIEWSKNITHNFRNYIAINVSLKNIDNEIYHVFEISHSTNSLDLFIETSLEDFFVALIENNRVLDYIWIENLVRKTDSFFEEIDKLLARNNIEIEYLDSIYTTKGPGSFTGARLGFSYAVTNKQLHKDILENDLKLKLAPTYSLFFKQLNKDVVYIKANKYNAYKISKLDNEISIELVNIENEIDKFNYSLFIKDTSNYLSLFYEVKNELEEELIYASNPQIGGV